jgi:hypothetical protein
LIDVLEYGFQVYGEHKELLTVSTSSMRAPWFPRWMTLAYQAAGQRGGCLDAAGKLHNWVQQIPNFENVVHRKFWIPSSPWLPGDDQETKRLNELGVLMTHDIKVSSSSHPAVTMY